jgi:phosphatidylglycerol lysyltransferase
VLLGLCAAVAVCYGTFGFWLLDKRDFGIDFSIIDAITRTLRELSLAGNSDLTPVSRHARWFLDSLRVLSIVSLCFAAYSIFRPVTYEVIILPGERARARQIVAEFGRSSYDHFKTWADRSHYFSETGRSFLSYRMHMGVAVCLGDPVGLDDELDRMTASFLRFCIDNGWQVVFLLSDLILMYEHLGFSLLKIAESAVVDLKFFCENTAKKKYFRYLRRKLESEGFQLTRYEPPHAQRLLEEVEEVSKEWLGLPGHREFGFLEGSFSREYLAGAPLTVLRAPDGQAVAFVNEIPSYKRGEATIDLMRHRPGVHWAAMDYIFLVLMQELWKKGYTTFYLGLANIADKPGPTMIEKAIYQISTHINWLIHAKGVRQYKEKFEPNWEDRYLAYYRTPLALTGYDNLALKHIRHPLGYGRTAFASYIGYAFSNTIGFSYISGGFIRYRFYSAWGLSAAEIARVVVFTIFSSFTGNWVDGDRTRPPRHDHQRCIRCFCCQETCPAGAIYVKKPPLRRIFFNY